MVSTDTDPPYFPIYHSTDLRTWTFVGNVLAKLPGWSRGKTWAPEIRWWAGKWRVYYAAGLRGGRMCIARASSPLPQGPYKDDGPVVCPRQGAIDPFLLVRDGAPWLVFKVMGAYSPIVMRRLDRSGRHVVGPPVTLIRPEQGWEEVTTEGPNMVRHGDWWYLFYSGGHCCTPPCTYKLGVARSRSALGPFVRRDEPLLRSNDQVACPGHGTLFTNGTGGWYMVHHGFVDGSGQRMPMISTIEWEEDGWPEVNNGFGALRDLDELADLTAAKVAAAAQAAIP